MPANIEFDLDRGLAFERDLEFVLETIRNSREEEADILLNPVLADCDFDTELIDLR